MAPNPVGMKLPKQPDPSMPLARSAGEWGRFAEDLGYDSIWSGEGWGTHALVDLTEAVCHTTDLIVGTAIASVFSRTPADLAMAAGTLSRISGGRVVVGVGSSHPEKVEDIHGREFHRPVRRVGETIELVKRLLGDEASVDYEGEVYAARGLVGLDEPVPVYNAALGEVNLRVTGWFADGWLPYLLPRSLMAESLETILAAAAERGRGREDITVSPQVLVAVDDDPAVARDVLRRYVASYLSRKAEFRRIFERVYPEEVAAIVGAWHDGDEEASMGHVTDEMLGEVGAAGTPEMAREAFARFSEADFIDRPIAYVPHGTDLETTLATYEALAPSG